MSASGVASIVEFGDGQGLRQFTELGVALVLSTLIGLERERRQKSAGMRTHTLVGVGAALFMLVSKHGFNDILNLPNVALDPSRVAAQIVSGIGFIGGGLIFVRRDAVRGLTTAATIWLTCGVGMACGGGLVLLAVTATAVHFLVVQGLPWLSLRLAPDRGGDVLRDVEVVARYRSSMGVLGRILETCTARGFTVTEVVADRSAADGDTTDEESRAEARYERDESPMPAGGTARVRLRLQGSGDANAVVTEIAEMDGLLAVTARSREEEVE